MSRLDTFNELCARSFPDGVSKAKRAKLMADVFKERVKYKTEIQDYFQYAFYNMDNEERRKYMTFSKLRYTMRVCNNPEKRHLFDDKAEFNKCFRDFINRDWLDVNEASYEEFEEFTKKHPQFFAKARVGMFGKSAGKHSVDRVNIEDSTKELYERMKEEGCLVEQLIVQHPDLASFNEDSANTLRVVTLVCADGEPKVMAGVLRIGRAGKCVDNFHHYGIAATIDINTGKVDTAGIDRDFRRYTIHPDSKAPITGFQVPVWEKVVDLVKRAALCVPDVRYVGWDVAIDENENVQLIEGNYGADPDVTQMPGRKGKWPYFEKEIKKIEALNA